MKFTLKLVDMMTSDPEECESIEVWDCDICHQSMPIGTPIVSWREYPSTVNCLTSACPVRVHRCCLKLQQKFLDNELPIDRPEFLDFTSYCSLNDFISVGCQHMKTAEEIKDDEEC